jgi:hypothetical protein
MASLGSGAEVAILFVLFHLAAGDHGVAVAVEIGACRPAELTAISLAAWVAPRYFQ